jgi:O-methyltransferase involved in polyketide biosynthesis
MKAAHTYGITLKKEMETLLITLYAKAMDNCSKNPILNDVKAEELLDQIDYDFEKLKGFGNEIMVIRAKQMDMWLNKFLEKNPNSTVLNLGCGLDTRISRIHPSSSVNWFDVDFPEVIDLRKHFFQNRPGYQMIPSSVTELKWVEDIPRDKPVMILAEGILEYLAENEVKELLHRLTHHFQNGQLAFDVMNAFAINAGKKNLKETTGAEHKWVVDTVHEVDRLNPNLKRAATLSIFKSKDIHKLPLKTRLIYSALCLFPSFKNMMRLLLYNF